jgi:hypothetical protein
LALFHIIFEELYLQLDEATRMLGKVFGSMETVSPFQSSFEDPTLFQKVF